MTDLLIRDVDVVDGTGAARYRADVLVDRGRITEIASPRTLSGADKTIAPEPGYALAPGFIDMHAHSDLRLLTDPGHFPKISQGVTTEVIGQDGISYAPIDDAALDVVRRQIAGWNGNPSDLDFSWRSVAGYLDRLDQGITPNAAYLVPQGTLRLLAVGADQRPATPTEIDRMQELLAQGLSEGAVGMSSGLTYTPGMYADTAELAALCEVVAEFGGFYAPHTRSYGAGALEAYAEMIELSRNTGCAVHLTHATMNFGVNRGRAPEFLDMVDAGLADGCDITLDTYPYLPGATTLSALLPSWAMSGGPDKALELCKIRRPARESPRTSTSTAPMAVTASPWNGRPSRSAEWVTPTWTSTSVGRSTRSRRTADLRRWRCSSICCSATSWPPPSCSMSATRRTSVQSWCTPSTWVAAMPFWSVTGHIRERGEPFRATWDTTSARSVC